MGRCLSFNPATLSLLTWHFRQGLNDLKAFPVYYITRWDSLEESCHSRYIRDIYKD